MGWKYEPFEKDGKPVTAEIEEYVDLLPPEQFPTVHIRPPLILPQSKIAIVLERTACFGTCPAYKLTISNDGIVFEGHAYVAAGGRHVAKVDLDALRALAEEFVAADFYSMEESYQAGVTDNPTYVLSISVDGYSKGVLDYVGSWVGMPSVISELEEKVDNLAQTRKWIEGGKGLAEALQDEKFDFRSYEAQVIAKESASRGMTQTVKALLAAGLPLEPISKPKKQKKKGTSENDNEDSAFETEPEGWLQAASRYPETLKVLIEVGASQHDQKDKDLALAGAAGWGNLVGARALIAYGANPNADLSKYTITEESGGMTLGMSGAGSILIYAARSGKPEMVREILKYRPKLEARDNGGKTAIFAAGEYRNSDEDGARAECVRLLVRAGANVNARDNDGNTPLHETFLEDVLEELLKSGADVNAQNNEGETPIFVTVSEEAISIFLKHGANLNIRNKEGKTVAEAIHSKGEYWMGVFQKAVQSHRKPE